MKKPRLVRRKGILHRVVGKTRLPNDLYFGHARPKAVPVVLVEPVDPDDEEYNYELDDFNFDCAREQAAFHGTRGRD